MTQEQIELYEKKSAALRRKKEIKEKILSLRGMIGHYPVFLKSSVCELSIDAEDAHYFLALLDKRNSERIRALNKEIEKI